MAEKEITTTKTAAAAHAEPKNSEILAAIDTKSHADKKSAPKKKTAVKKKSVSKKKVAVKKRRVIKKKSAVKKSSVGKTTVKPTETANIDNSTELTAKEPEQLPPVTVSNQTASVVETSVETETSPKTSAKPEDPERKRKQQQIQQRLVELGVADATKGGTFAHNESSHSNHSFWFKAIIALVVLVGLYFYSKGGDDTSSVSDGSQASMTHAENPVEKREMSASGESENGESTFKKPEFPENLPADAVEGSRENRGVTTPDSNTVETPEFRQKEQIPSYAYPAPWNPNNYPRFNMPNQGQPINPYSYPPINTAPRMAPPSYYGYPAAPY